MSPQAATSLPPGVTHVALGDVGSTNAEAFVLARQGRRGAFWVTAERQLQGRGRRGRPWVSEKGNLYASLLLNDPAPLERLGTLPLVAALAVYKALRPFFARTPQALAIKWPNDILIDGAKVNGILLESESAGGPNAAWVIAGTGVNIAHHPADAAIAATHLAEHMARPVSIGDLLHAYLTALDGWYARWLAEGFAPVRAGWLDRAQGLGEAVRVRTARETFSGRFDSLTADGALVVTTDDGQVRQVTAGDVMFGGARAAGD